MPFAMKTSLLLSLFVFLVISLFTPVAHAGKTEKKKEKDSEAKPPALSERSPSERLSEFFSKHLEHVLSPFYSDAGAQKSQPTDSPRLTVFRCDSVGAASLRVKLQAELTDMSEGFKRVGLNRPGPEQAPYVRALELCSQFTLILVDRQTRYERYWNSRKAQAPAIVESRGTKVERKLDLKAEIASPNKVSERMEQEWIKVSTEYRQTVSSMLDLVRLAEKEVRDAKATAKS